MKNDITSYSVITKKKDNFIWFSFLKSLTLIEVCVLARARRVIRFTGKARDRSPYKWTFPS